MKTRYNYRAPHPESLLEVELHPPY